MGSLLHLIARRKTIKRLGEGVAAVYASDGGGIDRSRVEPARSAPLSGPAVAAATDGLRKRRRRTIVEVGG